MQYEAVKTDNAPVNLIAFIAWLQRVVEQIPPEFKETAEIEIDEGRGDWEDAKFKIGYWRPPTEVEKAWVEELYIQLRREFGDAEV